MLKLEFTGQLIGFRAYDDENGGTLDEYSLVFL